MDSGACLSCGPLAFGNMCESCVPNSYDNNGTCLVQFPLLFYYCSNVCIIALQL